jgi:hypothetical protein
MPNWLKISLFVFVVLAVGVGAAVALKVRQLPEAASLENISTILAADIDTLREVSRESAEVDLNFSFEIFDDFDGTGTHPAVAAIAERSKRIEPLTNRCNEIDNPIILNVSLAHNVGSRHTRFRFDTQNGMNTDGVAPFSSSPTLGKPVVSRLLGTDRKAVRYSEVVLVNEEGVEIGFEMVLDLELLEQALPNLKPSPISG